MTIKTDVLIIGGGMVGMVLANLLAEKMNVVVVDRQAMKGIADLSSAIDSRVSAISRSSERLLQACGAWNRLPAERYRAYDAMRIWQADGSEELRFTAEEMAAPNLGHIIENQVIRAALIDAARTQPKLQLLQQDVDKLEIKSQSAHCRLNNGQIIEAPLLVGADGAQSRVRQEAGIPSHDFAYHQHALVANISTEKAHQSVCYQRFLGSGPIAYLPLAGANHHSIVWSVDDVLAEDLLALTPEQQAIRIGHALDNTLGDVQLLTPLRAFPLIARHSEHYVAHRVALVGDAAHTLHPLAGQGVNLGFLDAAELASQLLHLKQKERDWGLHRSLRPYERCRKGHNELMQKSMTGFHFAFKSQQPEWVVARNFGIGLLNQNRWLKNQLMTQAMGLDQDSSIFADFPDF